MCPPTVAALKRHRFPPAWTHCRVAPPAQALMSGHDARNHGHTQDRAGAAQSRRGRPAGNARKRARRVRRRRRDGADLVVFSELFITGYPPEDLVRKPAFAAAARQIVEALAAETGDGGPGVIVGTIWAEDDKLYNVDCAARRRTRRRPCATRSICRTTACSTRSGCSTRGRCRGRWAFAASASACRSARTSGRRRCASACRRRARRCCSCPTARRSTGPSPISA